jgi:hypothetical protein
VKYKISLPVLQAQTQPLPEVATLRMTIPSVSSNELLLTNGFHRFGLPELMMCNLIVDAASMAVFENTVHQLKLNLVDPRTRGNIAARALTATTFCSISFKGHTAAQDGKMIEAILRAGIRKLESNEERLILVALCEQGVETGSFTEADVQGICRVGVSIMETADEQNFLPGQPGYNWKRCSKINTVTVLH